MNHTKWTTAAQTASARVHFAVWAVHDAMHRAMVSLVPPTLLAIFKAVDSTRTHGSTTGPATNRSRLLAGWRDAEEGGWGKVRVCEGDEFGKAGWKEMSLV